MPNFPSVKPPIGSINWDQVDPNDGNIWQAKLDGAFLYYILGKNGIRAFSYRRSKRDDQPIEHTDKLYGLKDAKVPEHLYGAVLSGEAWHPDLASREIGGILNTRKSDIPESLHAAIHGIHKLPGMDITKLDNASKIRLLQGISAELPIFSLPDTATSPEDKQRLIENISSGEHPQTAEGIVIYPKKGIPQKAVLEPTHDVSAVGVTSGGGKYIDTGVGAILVGSPENPTRVGTGLSDKLRSVLHENPNLINGLVLKIKAKEKFPSGKYRAPVLVEFHPEKSDPDALRKLDKAMEKVAIIKYENGKHVLYTSDGSRMLGKHETHKGALRQERAIQMSKMRKHAGEFAPGIPMERDIKPIRAAEDIWELSIQEHDADVAGKHYDLRLGDPETGHGHSWALPKAMLPGESDRVRLAVQQPTHTLKYFDFEGKIPKGYGSGSVRLVHRAQTPVVSSSDKINFSVPGVGDMSLIRRDDKRWIIVSRNMSKQAQGYPQMQYIYQRPNYAAIGEERLKGGDYNTATAAGLGSVVGVGDMARNVAKDTQKIRNVHRKTKALTDIAKAERTLGRGSEQALRNRKRIASEVAKSKYKEIGKSMLKHAPRALAAAGITAAGLYGAKKLWDKAKSSRSRIKTAGDIVRLALLCKLAAFEMNTDPKLKVGVSPFKRSVTSKLKAPFKIQAPAVNVLPTGKSSEGEIVGQSTNANKV